MSRTTRRTDLHTVVVGDQCLVLDPSTSVLHALNPSATLVWDLLDGTAALPELATDIAAATGSDIATVEADVIRLVDGLHGAGLLEGSTRGPRPTTDRTTDIGPRIVRAGAPTPWQHRAVALSAIRRHDIGSGETIGPYDALGFRFTVETADRDLATFLDTSFRSLRAGPTGHTDPGSAQRYRIVAPDHPSGPRRRWGVYLDDVRVLSPATPAQLTYHLLGHISVMSATAAEHDVLLHAAAIGTPAGAVLMPATSGAGKSTLVAALAAAGSDYLTDELVALDPARLVARGLRRPIVVKPGSWDVLAAMAPAVTDGGQRFSSDTWLVAPPGTTNPPPGPQPVAALVLPTFDPAGPDSITPIAPAEAVAGSWAHLWPSTVPAEAALDALVALCTSTPAYRLRRSGTESLPGLLATIAPHGT